MSAGRGKGGERDVRAALTQLQKEGFGPHTEPTNSWDVFDAAREERARAHAKHGNKSMEGSPWDHEKRLRILLEEVGEVARALNEYDIAAGHLQPHDLVRLQAAQQCRRELGAELKQVCAMAGAWADAVQQQTSRYFRGEIDSEATR